MSKREEDELEEEVRKNIEYLEQTSSVIYNKVGEGEEDNFTGKIEKEPFRVKRVTKLAATSDSKAIRTCQFSSSGNLFAVGTNSSILKIFDVQGLFGRNTEQEILPIYQIEGLHLKSIFCLQWGSNERSLVTCSNDLHVHIQSSRSN
jgi:WD40 repeat protein